jgi:two-component system CheB/CheR fusion protein
MIEPSQTIAERVAEESVDALKRALAGSEDRLRSSLQYAQSSTEELRASNEELQAMNEELRSASEELEASREELQSLNEELSPSTPSCWRKYRNRPASTMTCRT